MDTETIPTNTKNTEHPYRQDVYDLYVAWKSIPACLRVDANKEIADHLSDDDEAFKDLYTIKTQGEFAQKYDIEPSTLTNWNKLIVKQNVLSETRKWAQA
jgi:hypothetical protein